MKNFFNSVLNLFEEFEINDLEDVILAFSLIKLMDSVLIHSKENIIKIYAQHDESDRQLHDDLITQAVYPNGDEVGFYNYSKFDLDKLSEIGDEAISDKFLLYLDSFSANVKSLFDKLNLFNFIKSTSTENLYFIISGLSNIAVDDAHFNSIQNLNRAYYSFLNEYNSYFSNNTYMSFVSSVLMNAFADKDNVLMDACDDGLFISEINDKFDWESIYLVEENRKKYAIALSRMILANRKTSHLSCTCDFKEVNFDLIISNNPSKNSSKETIKKYVENLDDVSKILIVIDSNDVNEHINYLLDISPEEILEAVISLPLYQNNDLSVLILSNEKIKNESTLFINEDDLLIDNKIVHDWKFIISKLSKIIRNSYSTSYGSDKRDNVNVTDAFDNITFEKKRSGHEIFIKDSTRKHIKSNKSNAGFDFKDIEDATLDDFIDGGSNEKKQGHVRNVGNYEIESGSSFQEKISPGFDRNKINLQNRPNLDEFVKNASGLINGDIEVVELSQIASLSIEESIDDDSLYIINSDKSDKSAFFGDELTDFDSSNLVKVSLKTESTTLSYLNVYLNSKTGLNEINHVTKDYYDVNPTNLANVRILIPEMINQMFIVTTYQEAEEFIKSISNLMDNFQENIFDYKKMLNSINEFRGNITLDSDGHEITEMSRNWRYTYSRLIWPLAITYLSATRGGYENTDKAKKYLILFEFIAAFNSIVMLSGLPDEVYDEYKWSNIWKKDPNSGYGNINFGDWRFFSKDLSDLYNDNDFATDFDRKLFDSISSSKVNSLIKKAHFLRNKYFHEGMMTPRQSELFLEKLNGHLSKIFDVLEVYSEYKLFYVLGVYEAGEDVIKNRVIHLNGPCKQPIYGYFDFDKMLPKEALFLYNPINKKLLRLKDNLIKFRPIDEFEKQWGIYIFNGVYTTNGVTYAKYKNFQERDDEYTVSIESFEEDIVG